MVSLHSKRFAVFFFRPMHFMQPLLTHLTQLPERQLVPPVAGFAVFVAGVEEVVPSGLTVVVEPSGFLVMVVPSAC
jgi:hypothetical protein